MEPAAVHVTEVAPRSDSVRVRGARAGDVRAFELMVAEKVPSAFRLASAMLGSEAEAADATQNALVAAWRALPGLRDCAAFDAWFGRILVNECRMAVRRRTRLREIPPEAAVPARRGDGSVATTLTKVEVLDRLDAAFEQLDPEDQAMVVLHHLEHRPPAEIALSLHLPVGTVRWRLHEAQQALQRALEVE